MERITKREFIQHTSKHIKPSVFILTNHGVDEYLVTIVATNGIKNEQGELKIATTDKDREQRISLYGCGCPKTDDLLCQKHGRQ